jgi:hypothetical protein
MMTQHDSANLALPLAACYAMLRRNMTASPQKDPEALPPAPSDTVAEGAHSATSQVFRSKVYCDGEAQTWIVEPPRDKMSTVGKMIFTGPRAQQRALTYAYETFGNARFFPY